MAFTISSGTNRTYTEGSFVTFTWRMERPDGLFVRNTTVPYTIVGLNAQDLVGTPLTGSVAIDRFGSGSLTIRLAEDLTTEGNESFYVSSNANFTPFSSNSVTVVDTSVAPRPPSPPPPPPTPAPPPPPPAPPPVVNERFFNGSGQADQIVGTDIRDTLRVSRGADRFDGGGGVDTFDLSGLYSVMKEGERLLIGRTLADTYHDIIVRADMGRSTRSVELVTTNTRYQLFERTTFDINTTLVNVENLIGTEFSDQFTGNAAANGFRTGAGRDSLYGLDGDDTLAGGDGADLVDGGNGTDTAVLSGLASNYRFVRSGNDVLATRTVNGRDETDTLRSIERVQFDNGTVDTSSLLPPIRTHQLTALSNTVNEGGVARFELRTTGYTEGNRVGYSISGISGADVLNVPLWNLVTINAQGSAIIEFNITADQVTEGDETLTVTVENATARMTVKDTSTLPGINGTTGNDNLFGTNAGDLIDGRAGNDRIDGANGNDTLLGGAGEDYLIGGSGDDTLDGQTGNDFMMGGVGNDIYFVDASRDIVSEIAGPSGGVDEVRSRISYTLGLDAENLLLMGSDHLLGTGNTQDNILTGNAGNNTLDGRDGNDRLLGGDGADRLIGGFGADTLTGGAGNDVFVYGSVAHSPNSAAFRDVIADFVRGQDKIDLSAIDARASTSGINDAFTFLSSAPLTALQSNGAVWFSNGIVYASIDSTPTAEIAIQVVGVNTLSVSDFVL